MKLKVNIKDFETLSNLPEKIVLYVPDSIKEKKCTMKSIYNLVASRFKLENDEFHLSYDTDDYIILPDEPFELLLEIDSINLIKNQSKKRKLNEKYTTKSNTQQTKKFKRDSSISSSYNTSETESSHSSSSSSSSSSESNSSESDDERSSEKDEEEEEEEESSNNTSKSSIEIPIKKPVSKPIPKAKAKVGPSPVKNNSSPNKPVQKSNGNGNLKKNTQPIGFNDTLTNKSYLMNYSDIMKMRANENGEYYVDDNDADMEDPEIAQINYDQCEPLIDLPIVGDKIAFQKNIISNFNMTLSKYIEGIVVKITNNVLYLKLNENGIELLEDFEYLTNDGVLEVNFSLLQNAKILERSKSNEIDVKFSDTNNNNNSNDKEGKSIEPNFVLVSPDKPLNQQITNTKKGNRSTAVSGILKSIRKAQQQEEQQNQEDDSQM
ncbi:hypothetical protein DLAC_09755 [Tieghemostelium lacteum]|uniref:Coilin n=1 Tax=Tieghemostelium lacteum TaxID=361077 RepID=A0A151Z782_TIELA|nr:hypothetical protein DLAC_09755 [Tieghemostelium lacteum]|eukprot:KYQ89787.1 hypothetical protein DLAC_09755 [Tieghemostelium lacteum]